MIHGRPIRYAKHDRIADWLAIGWHFIGPASHHSVYVVWLCDCNPAVPA